MATFDIRINKPWDAARKRIPLSHLSLHVVLLFAALTSTVFGQAHRAIVLGRVVDQSGGVIPGVEVKVIHKATNTKRQTVTNDNGNYEVPGLFPGIYRIEAGLPGFKTSVVDDVPVASGQRVPVDVKLEVGDLSDSVKVDSSGEILEAANADVNTIFRAEALQAMPIGQGHASYVLFKAPGVNMTAARGGGSGDDQPNNRGATGQTQVNGSPNGTTEFTIDGSPNTQRPNGGAGGGISFNPTTDVVDEVRVQTNAFDASVGHTGGATIDVVLKSGTNEYHGTGYGYMRDPNWQANSWNGNRTGQPRPDFTYRRWGFTGGGRVRLGKIYNGKDRTFFFYGFEKWANLGNPPVTGTVPRENHLQGDFSDLLALGPQYQLYDPDSGVLSGGRIQRTPFPNNRIPQNRIDPVAQKMIKLWPAPNLPGTADGRNNFSYFAGPLPRSFWNSVLRIDQALGTSHRLYGRFLRGNDGIPLNSLYGRTDISNAFLSSRNVEFGLSEVWAVSRKMVAEFRAALSRFHSDTKPIGTDVPYDSLGLGYLSKFFHTKIAGIPNISIAEYVNIQGTPSRTGFFNFAPSLWATEIRSASVNVTRMMGNHSLKFGADTRGYIDNRGTADYLTISFTGAYSRGPFNNSPASPIGQALADFLLGRYASASLVQSVKPANLATYYGLYLHDDWKVTPRLTINMGLRWEREGPPTERFNRSVSSFDTVTPNPIQDAVRANYASSPIEEIPIHQFNVLGGVRFASVDGNPRTAYDSDNNNFAPRIGIAYRLTDKTVLRTGYGIFFIPYGQRFYAAEAGVPGFDITTTDLSSPDGGATFTHTLSNLFSNGLDVPITVSQGLKTNLGRGVSIATALRRLPNAYNQRWQLEIQRLFGRNYRLQVRYVGNRTVKMPIRTNLNALPTRFLSTSPERDQATIDRLNGLVANPFFGIAGISGALGSSSQIARQSLLTRFPQFGSVLVQTTNGWTAYHGLQVEFQKTFSNGFAFQTNYTFSKTMEALGYLNAGDDFPTKVIATGDRPHMWRLLTSYHLPLGRGRALGPKEGLLGHIISGWQLHVVGYHNSGLPTAWPDVIFRGNLKDIPVSHQTAERMFNTEAGFERAASRQLAFHARTFPLRLASVRDQGSRAWELALLKETTIRDGMTIQFRAETYNALNQHYFCVGADTNPASTAFGTTSIDCPGPRTVQLGLRFIF